MKAYDFLISFLDHRNLIFGVKYGYAMGPTTYTTVQEIGESLYDDLDVVEDAVLEVNEFRDAVNPETSATHYRVAVTDGEDYSFSGPLDTDSRESIRQGLSDASTNLSGSGRPLDEPLGEVGEYLSGKH